jgi:hypothetical protein
VPSPPHPPTFRGRQLSLLIPVDPFGPVDVPKDIVVGQKRLTWAR